MPGRLSAVAVLFLSLAVILHGYQIREKEFPKSRDYLQYTSTVTGQTTAKPLLQLVNQTHRVTLAARSRDGHIQMSVEDSTPENIAHTTTKAIIPVTTKRLLPSIPVNYTFVTPNNSHVATLSTEGTIGPSSVAHLPVHTTGTSLSTVNNITGRTPQLGGQTTFHQTFFTALHKTTTNQKPTPPTYVPGASVPTHKVSFESSPAPIVPGPTLATQLSPAKTGTYEVLNGSRLCIKAEMGLELIVQEKDLEENSYYVSEVGAYLTVSNTERTYQGMKHRMVMFETVVGHSFKCVSEQSIQLSAQLQMKTRNIRLQAFDFEGDCFGNVDECLSDYTVVLPVIGAIVVVLCVVGLAVYTIRQRHQSLGYQRI
ncbi:lysosome-associated membrane glycoprotein 3 isoform X2 [Mesocricetus auratus]|uniref:Lysosome-associated membrane glycoprotein 3 isoform X2 n=1 Tax=Mesocricetus auratus TaxID=10036 RepID=A0A3Q0CYA8_MESAU|nr:lysosome-associated membrane glycoprotein 3 isoform X2 [Mesocricetus auratus]